jgi:hypothetical protein
MVLFRTSWGPAIFKALEQVIHQRLGQALTEGFVTVKEIESRDDDDAAVNRGEGVRAIAMDDLNVGQLGDRGPDPVGQISLTALQVVRGLRVGRAKKERVKEPGTIRIFPAEIEVSIEDLHKA